jgi:hypothetical protein
VGRAAVPGAQAARFEDFQKNLIASFLLDRRFNQRHA